MGDPNLYEYFLNILKVCNSLTACVNDNNLLRGGQITNATNIISWMCLPMYLTAKIAFLTQKEVFKIYYY